MKRVEETSISKGILLRPVTLCSSLQDPPSPFRKWKDRFPSPHRPQRGRGRGTVSVLRTVTQPAERWYLHSPTRSGLAYGPSCSRRGRRCEEQSLRPLSKTINKNKEYRLSKDFIRVWRIFWVCSCGFLSCWLEYIFVYLY